MLQIPRKNRFVMALYCIVRSLSDYRSYSTATGSSAKSAFGAEAAFVLANVAIMWSFFTEPDLMDQGYRRWVQWMGNLKGNPQENHCTQCHPGCDCSEYYIDTLCKGLGRAATMYGKVYVLASLFRPNKAFKRPIQFFREKAKNLALSSLFLSTYQANAKAIICHYRKPIQATGATWPAILSGAVAGGSIWVERKSRRRELALYCMPRAVEIVLNKYVKTFCDESSFLVRAGPEFATAAFAISFGLWMLVLHTPGFDGMNGLNKGIIKVVYGVGGLREPWL